MPVFEAPVAAPPVQASPAAARVYESPVVMPSVHPNPFLPPVQTSPSERPVHDNPFLPPAQAEAIEEVPVHASPVTPPVHASPVVRPDYVSPVVEQPEDVNPIVRPAYESPIARPVVEELAHTSALAPPVAETAISASAVEPAIVEPAIVEPPIVEPAIVEPAIVEPAIVEPPIVGPPAIDVLVHTSVLEQPVAEEPLVEPVREANSFETAPTELPLSETPLAAGTNVEETPAQTPSVELAATQAPVPTAPFPAPAPARSFSSSGSEMPVVITTPPPYRRDSSAPPPNLFAIGRELLPRAQAWSQKTLRANPRALVVAAPLVALLGIWAIRSVVSHPKRAVAEGNAELAAQVAAPTPAPQVAASANVASPAAPILVSTSAAPSAAPPGAEPAELASAVTHGLPALESLAQKFPNDPQVGIALASQQAQAQRFEAAVGSVERVISVDPKSAQNGKVMGILWRAAQSSASEESFAALRKLGARGSDIAFDLATTSGVRDAVRERAKSELQKSLSAEASADTRVASALLLAPNCAARKSLLARAEREGGKRTQAMLERFSRGSACSKTTDKACNSCLTGSPALAHALAQLSTGEQK